MTSRFRDMVDILSYLDIWYMDMRYTPSLGKVTEGDIHQAIITDDLG